MMNHFSIKMIIFSFFVLAYVPARGAAPSRNLDDIKEFDWDQQNQYYEQLRLRQPREEQLPAQHELLQDEQSQHQAAVNQNLSPSFLTCSLAGGLAGGLAGAFAYAWIVLGLKTLKAASQ